MRFVLYGATAVEVDCALDIMPIAGVAVTWLREVVVLTGMPDIGCGIESGGGAVAVVVD